MIDRELYFRKIQQLSDDKLRELLKLRTNANADLMVLAENESVKRGIDPQSIVLERKPDNPRVKGKEDDGINWPSVLADFFSGL